MQPERNTATRATAALAGKCITGVVRVGTPGLHTAEVETIDNGFEVGTTGRQFRIREVP